MVEREIGTGRTEVLSEVWDLRVKSPVVLTLSHQQQRPTLRQPTTIQHDKCHLPMEIGFDTISVLGYHSIRYLLLRLRVSSSTYSPHSNLQPFGPPR